MRTPHDRPLFTRREAFRRSRDYFSDAACRRAARRPLGAPPATENGK